MAKNVNLYEKNSDFFTTHVLIISQVNLNCIKKQHNNIFLFY